MIDWNDMSAAKAEAGIFTELQTFDRDERLRYSQIGLMAAAVEKRELWKMRTDPATDYPCRSMNRWVQMCCPYAAGTVHAAMRDVEALADVPADDLAQIPQANLSTMKLLSSKVRKQPAVLAAAKSSEGFVAYIQQHHADQHVSRMSSFRLTPTEEQKAEIEEAIDLAIQCGDARSKEEAVFGWAVGYKQERQGRVMEEGKCAHA